MKKFLLTLCASTPSVKGIYTALFILILTTCVSAQIELKDNAAAVPFYKWEIGINLNILRLKDDPYSIVIKRHISKHIALRLGFSLIYNTVEQFHLYDHPYTDTIHFVIYNYRSRIKKMAINSFIGAQYGIKKKNWYWYMATDGLFKYGREKNEVFDLNIAVAIPAPYHSFEAGSLGGTKIMGLGVRQSLGFQYFITKNFSFGAEGSFLFEADRLTANDIFQYIISDGTTATTYTHSFVYSIYPTLKYWNYNLRLSPIALVSFNYHF